MAPTSSPGGGEILLGIDTCGAAGSLALGRAVRDTGGSRLELLGGKELAGRSTAAMLVPTLGQLLAEAGVALGQLGGIVAVDGPGSFTGIRIGLSAAKALAEALGLPLCAVSRLEVLAASHGAVHAALDAGRGELYYGCYPAMYAAEDGLPSEEASPPAAGEWLLSPRELLSTVAGRDQALVICEEKLLPSLPGALLVPPPTASQALEVGMRRLLRGETADPATLDGRYLRRSGLFQPAAGSAAGV